MYKYFIYTFFQKSISQRHAEGPDSDPASFPLGDHYLRGETLQGGRKGEKLEIGYIQGIAMINTGSDQKHDPAKSPNDLGGKVSRFRLVCVYIYIDT